MAGVFNCCVGSLWEWDGYGGSAEGRPFLGSDSENCDIEAMTGIPVVLVTGASRGVLSLLVYKLNQ
jgi:hypothetical protein